MMLGLGSVEIALVFWLCILAAAGCTAYGAWKWNAGKPDKLKTVKKIVPGGRPTGTGQAGRADDR